MQMATDNKPAFKTKDAVVSESEFCAKEDASGLLAFLRHERVTGQLVIHLGQGGVQRIVLIEKQAVEIQP